MSTWYHVGTTPLSNVTISWTCDDSAVDTVYYVWFCIVAGKTIAIGKVLRLLE